MSRSLRAPAVRRHLAYPLWWTALACLVAAAFFAGDVRTALHEDDRIARALHVEGVVEPTYARNAEVPVRYDNPATRQRVTATAYPKRVQLPEPGAAAHLDVDPDDPGLIFLAGDRRTAFTNAPAYAWLPLFPLAVVLLRRLRLRRVETLLAGSGPAFAMLATLEPPRRFAKRCELALYALDSSPETAPVCSVPVLNTTGAPLGEVAFRVEVKGFPRPGGTVVARRGEDLFWPAGPAALQLRGRRPERIVDREAPVAAGTGRGTVGHPLPSDVPHVSPLFHAPRLLLGLAASIALLVPVAAGTLANRAAIERLDREGIRVLATLQDLPGTDYRKRLVYRLPDDTRDRTTTVAVDVPEHVHADWRYPLFVDPAEPEHVHLPAVPYNAVAPIAYAAVPAVLTAVALLRRVTRWRGISRLARRGPWHPVDAWLLPGDDSSAATDSVLALATPGGPYVRCTVRVPRRQAFAVAPWGSRARLEAAGRLEPGQPVALRAGTCPLTVTEVAGARVKASTSRDKPPRRAGWSAA